MVIRRYVAFDIETAKIVPGEDFNWKPHRPLGITCASVLRCDSKETEAWYGKKRDGSPAAQMSRAEAGKLVQALQRLVEKGYTLLTWNGLGFDLDVLAEESGCLEECREMALNHVDMMFHVFCDRGFPVKLEKAAQALGIPGKPPGMSGVDAPRSWQEGRHQEVLEYNRQDVRTALGIARECEKRGRFEWITKNGEAKSFGLPRGWLVVRDANSLPQPDTSWMRTPILRSEFTGWLGI